MIKPHIAVFASGNGTNAEAIFNHFKNHPLIEVVGLLTNNPKAFVLDRAKNYSVPTLVFNRKIFYETHEVLDWMKAKVVTHVALAGFMWHVPAYLTEAYPDKIINIHPALLPKYGGKGMYGSRVHEAVKSSGDQETGITIHLVNEVYDDGKILFQDRCSVEPDYTPNKIAEKVHTLEHKHYPVVIERWINGDPSLVL
jgi:phosphoribosylglycinamide formyltransferase-1